MVVKTYSDNGEEVGLTAGEASSKENRTMWEHEAPPQHKRTESTKGVESIMGKAQHRTFHNRDDDGENVLIVTRRTEEMAAPLARSSQHSSSSPNRNRRRRLSSSDSTWTTRALVSQAYALVSNSGRNLGNNQEDEDEPTKRFNRISNSQQGTSSRKKKKNKQKSAIKSQQSLLALAVEEKKNKVSREQNHNSILPSFHPIDWHMETPTKEKGRGGLTTTTKSSILDPSLGDTPATVVSNITPPIITIKALDHEDDDDDDNACPLWNEMKNQSSPTDFIANEGLQLSSSSKIDFLHVKSIQNSYHRRNDSGDDNDDDWKEHYYASSNTTTQTTTCAETDDISITALEGRHPVLAELVDIGRTLLRHMKNRCWKKKTLMACVIILFVLVVIDILFLGNIKSWLIAYVDWMEDHIFLGGILFIGVLVITTLCFVPPIFLTFGCGYIFAKFYTLSLAVLGATCTCFLGTSMGAMIAFLRARYMTRDLIFLFVQRYSTMGAIDRAISKKGFRIMVLLRLCPIIPFNSLNFIGGITKIPLEKFMYSLVGVLPMQALTVAMGATAGDFRWNGMIVTKDSDVDHTHTTIRTTLLVVGLIFAVVAMIVAYMFTRKELQKEFNMLESQAEDKRREEDDNEVVIWKSKCQRNSYLELLGAQVDQDGIDNKKEPNDMNDNENCRFEGEDGGGCVSTFSDKSWEDEYQRNDQDKVKDVEKGKSAITLSAPKTDGDNVGKKTKKKHFDQQGKSKTKQRQRKMDQRRQRQLGQKHQELQVKKNQKDEELFLDICLDNAFV